MVRCFCFQVLYEVQASVCPVLSSDLLMISASASGDRSSSVIDYLLVFVGDTAGMVSVWLVRSSSIHTSSSSRSIKLIQLEQYSAHDMGANCISAAIVPSDMQQPCLLHPPEGGTCHHHDRCCCSWHVVVVSGGDDQALTCSQLVVSVSASSADEVGFNTLLAIMYIHMNVLVDDLPSFRCFCCCYCSSKISRATCTAPIVWTALPALHSRA